MINYTITITDRQQKILENDLLDITDWIDKAIAGKINSCMKRAAKEYGVVAEKNNIISIPSSLDNRADALFLQGDYKNRQERDAEFNTGGE